MQIETKRKLGQKYLYQIKDFKTETITRDKEGHYTIIKGSIQQEDIMVKIYAPNIGAPKYIKKILTDIKEKLTVTE